jgi:hypothetical protein
MRHAANARSLKMTFIKSGHEAIIAASMSNIGPLAKAERQAGAPIEAVVVEVNHDGHAARAIDGVQCAKEISPPIKIVALCCCPQAITEAIRAGCAAAFRSNHDHILPTAISNILAD